ncbi:TPA: hypothetical protein DDZ86_00340 [Candidatus Dependentiae bacterium]|nr:MAG: hypothetical protein UW09_C0002G0054 [candidate division TM6 bacterium GW2011_GWF2_43_87]HBL98077.1 hypothetical protein [Candidatus Dependentiae bacterium]
MVKKISALLIVVTIVCVAHIAINASNQSDKKVPKKLTVKMFYEQVKNNKCAEVENLLKKYPALATSSFMAKEKSIKLEESTFSCCSPLFVTKEKAMVELLLQYNSDPNIFHPGLNYTPFFRALLEALITKNFDLPNLFLKYGVDLTISHRKKKDKKTPFFQSLVQSKKTEWKPIIDWFATTSKDPDFVDSYGRSLLFWTVQQGLFDTTKILLKRGANPNKKNIFGDTPFSLALKSYAIGRPVMPSLLLMLTYGADLKTLYKKENLIHYFLTYCKDQMQLVRVLSLLIKKGVDPCALNVQGMTPLQRAALLGAAEAIKILVGKAAVPVDQTSDGVWKVAPPLILALSNNMTSSVETLVSLGADLTKPIGEGSYPIHFVKKSVMLPLFFKKNVDLNVQDSEGKTPLHYAVINKNQRLAVLLSNAGARRDICDNEGKKPCDYNPISVLWFN